MNREFDDFDKNNENEQLNQQPVQNNAANNVADDILNEADNIANEADNIANEADDIAYKAGINDNVAVNIDKTAYEENQANNIITEKQGKPAKKKNSIGKEIFEWVLVIVAALVISMLIKAFVFSTYKVTMNSMENTLQDGQHVIVYKTGYMIGEPKRGDIIVFVHEEGKFEGVLKYLPIANPGEVDYIKRVIGLPGDVIDIQDGKVLRKNAGETEFIELDEPYIKDQMTESNGMKLPYTVEENKLFVMGDNRLQSLDSRKIGTIDRDKVVGKAVFRIWPFSEFGGVYGNTDNSNDQ